MADWSKTPPMTECPRVRWWHRMRRIEPLECINGWAWVPSSYARFARNFPFNPPGLPLYLVAINKGKAAICSGEDARRSALSEVVLGAPRLP